MSPHPVPGIEPLCIGALKPACAINEVGFRGFQQKMAMVAHQDKGMDQPTISFRDLCQGVEASFIIPFILENRRLSISPAHDMNDGGSANSTPGFLARQLSETEKRLRFNPKNNELGGLTRMAQS